MCPRKDVNVTGTTIDLRVSVLGEDDFSGIRSRASEPALMLTTSPGVKQHPHRWERSTGQPPCLSQLTRVAMVELSSWT